MECGSDGRTWNICDQQAQGHRCSGCVSCFSVRRLRRDRPSNRGSRPSDCFRCSIRLRARCWRPLSTSGALTVVQLSPDLLHPRLPFAPVLSQGLHCGGRIFEGMELVDDAVTFRPGKISSQTFRGCESSTSRLFYSCSGINAQPVTQRWRGPQGMVFVRGSVSRGHQVGPCPVEQAQLLQHAERQDGLPERVHKGMPLRFLSRTARILCDARGLVQESGAAHSALAMK